MRNYKILFLLQIVLLFFTGCLTINIERVENTVDEEYFDKKFGDTFQFGLGEIAAYEIKELLDLNRRSIVEDKDLTDQEKELRISEINEFELHDYKYFNFGFNSATPFFGSEIDFRFKLYDSKNNDLLENVFYFPYKTKHTTYYSGYAVSSYTRYNHVWLIKANKPITTEYISEEEAPVYLEVEFPNGQMRSYSVKPSIEKK